MPEPWQGVSGEPGRGIGRGLIHTADGQLVVTVVQEGLIRRMH